ncbi:MAG: cytidylate kinase-like family protein [Deltaproteobacteria bacterium]|nr:cytidylate kinase-like family protein [Deltaproteobacteria bacterium]
MAIITISRGSYSKGKEVAEKVAEKLGYQCISRDVLLEASKEFNISEIKLVRAIHDAPSILKGLKQSKEQYIAYIRAAVLKHLCDDNIVYHGLAGHFFVSGISHVLKVRILADLEDRVQLEMEREKITRGEALSLIRKDDEERRRWSKELYGIDTWDPALYDLVIHIRELSTDDAAELIGATAAFKQFATTPESRKAIHDLALAAEVKAALMDVQYDVDVQADGGRVFVQTHASPAIQQQLREQINAVVKRMTGVKDVTIKLTRITPYEEY